VDKQQYDTIKLQINQEKEHVIDEMYQEDCKKLAKAQEKLEEKMLLDLKMCMNG